MTTALKALFTSLLFVAVLGCMANVSAQRKRTPDNSRSVRLNERKPTIYLDFVRTGKCRYTPTSSVLAGDPCSSSRTDIIETFDAVWLRLVNNTRWAIQVHAKNLFIAPTADGFVLADRRVVTAVNDGREIDTIYGAEAETGCDFHEEAPPGKPCKLRDAVVPEIPLPGISSPIWIPSGRSAIFAVKREHLSKYLNVFVLYSYEWETDEKRRTNFEEPKHRVYFGWFALETALKN
jgi:hypothetical protein